MITATIALGRETHFAGLEYAGLPSDSENFRRIGLAQLTHRQRTGEHAHRYGHEINHNTRLSVISMGR